MKLNKILHLRFILCLLVFLTAFSNVQAAQKQTVVSGLRFGVHKDVTRFVLDLNKKVKYDAFVIRNPYRVVIDLPKSAWKIQKHFPAPKYSIIENYRHGAFKPNVHRIVLDAKGPVDIKKSFYLKPNGSGKHRLVIDMIEAKGKPKALRKYKAPKKPKKQAKATPTKKRKPNKKPVVVIDAGHGGVDPGAIGARRVYEKRITLEISRRIKQELEKTGRYTVHLTRNRDVYLKLKERRQIAQDKNADLFISIHADSIKNKSLRGLSVYTLSEKSSDKVAAALARNENRSDLIAGIDFSEEPAEVKNILIDLAQRETMNLSSKFAEILLRKTKGGIRLLRRPHRFAGFAVLKSVNIPSVLIEVGFLSNKHDARLLVQKSFQGKFAKSLIKAIDEYFRNQKL